MIKKLLSAAVFCGCYLSPFATQAASLFQPVLITSTASEVAESCLKDKKCAKKIDATKSLLTKIFHSFNVMHIEMNASPLKYASTKFNATVNHDAKIFREQAIGDAEQVISFAVQDFETMDAGKKLRLKIYTVLFTEGSLFFVQADVTFISSTGNDKWQVDSYESISK